jgi:hypothetical protein
MVVVLASSHQAGGFECRVVLHRDVGPQQTSSLSVVQHPAAHACTEKAKRCWTCGGAQPIAGPGRPTARIPALCHQLIHACSTWRSPEIWRTSRRTASAGPYLDISTSRHLDISTSSVAMALRDLPSRAASALLRDARPLIHANRPSLCRHASFEPLQEVAQSTSFAVPPPSDDLVHGFDPVARSRTRRLRKKPLPPSRCAS